MALSPILPTDEQAKAIQEAARLGSTTLETVRAFGGFLSRVLGTPVENIVGLLGGDWLEYKRMENLAVLGKHTADRLEQRGVRITQEVPLSLGLPLLRAAADESREDLLKLWASLLASAMDPSRQQNVRRSFVEIVSRMDPLDARVFQYLDGTSKNPSTRDFLAAQFQVSANSVEVSIVNLAELGCVMGDMAGFQEMPIIRLTAKGRELRAAVL